MYEYNKQFLRVNHNFTCNVCEFYQKRQIC
jgi:hypothetical protein